MNKPTVGPIKVTEQIIDSNTGELLFNSSIQTKDKNFYKFWIDNLMPYMKENYSLKEIIFFKLVNLMDKHNKINLTIKDICKKLDIKDRHFRIQLNELKRFDIIRKIKNGTYMINPDVIYKSTSENRTIALKEYYSTRESKELIAEKERQKKIKNTKSKLKKLTSEELLKIATSQNLDDTIFTELAERLVDGGKEIK